MVKFATAFGTGTLPTGTSVPFPRGEGVFWTVFGTGTKPTGTSVPFSRGEEGLLTGLRHEDHAHRYSSGIPACRRGSSGRSLARGPCPQVLQWHPGVAKGSSGRSRSGHLSMIMPVFGTATMPTGTSGASSRGEASFNRSRTGLFPMILPTLRHGDHAHKYSSGILAWRRGLLTGLRHEDHAHRYLSAIPAWRRGLLDGLRHGDHAHRYSSGIPAWRRGLLTGLWHSTPGYR